jgi:hypothetical protein
VPAGDPADGVDHHHHRDPEGQADGGHLDQGGLRTASGGGVEHDHRADAEEDQHERAEQLSGQLLTETGRVDVRGVRHGRAPPGWSTRLERRAVPAA